VGGEMTYRLLDSNIIDRRYQVSLVIYEDCANGSPAAIALDNPAFFGTYDGDGNFVHYDSAFFSSVVNVPVNLNSECITNAPNVCLFKKTFLMDIHLPLNATGYSIAYQRCCRNSALVNINSPVGTGSTYLCYIPGSNSARFNNSAIFTDYPPLIICNNYPIHIDNWATDPDGDSLSYEFCDSYTSPDGLNNNTIPFPPPYTSVNFNAPYTFAHPMPGFPSINLNQATGEITGTPNWNGRYLVTLCCHEWRHGVLINTISRDFQFVVSSCSRNVVADLPQFSDQPNTYVLNCNNNTVDFVNTSKGGTQWVWEFGIPGTGYDTSYAFQPAITYPDTGVYTVKLVVNPGTICADSISKLVKIYPGFKTLFSDTGRYCIGSDIAFIDHSTHNLRPLTGWAWNFGDGNTSPLQDPEHSYDFGGRFNVQLVSQNEVGCIDTLVKHLDIENFHPFGGNDTTIVKGTSLQFYGVGGQDFRWRPSENLNDSALTNPVGYFADTGLYIYTLTSVSAYGCTGYDTVRVHVVNQAAFYMPTAFSPNGDGLNDVFRPRVVGCKELKYIRVFDRWGAEVYISTSTEQGWNGRYNGHDAELGTYYWEVEFVDRFDKTQHLKGDVTLVR